MEKEHYRKSRCEIPVLDLLFITATDGWGIKLSKRCQINEITMKAWKDITLCYGWKKRERETEEWKRGRDERQERKGNRE